MNRTQLNGIMKRNAIFECEIDDAIAFVSELLEQQVKELREKEPYAVRTIQELETAANNVWNLQDYVSELEEE